MWDYFCASTITKHQRIYGIIYPEQVYDFSNVWVKTWQKISHACFIKTCPKTLLLDYKWTVKM